VTVSELRMYSLDPALLAVERARARAGESRWQVRGVRDGLARLLVSAGGWRAETTFVPVGGGTIALMRDAFASGIDASRWQTLGEPRPTVERATDGSGALVLNADRQWQSGLLSRDPVPLRSGLVAGLSLEAASDTLDSAVAAITLALVDAGGVVTPEAPLFVTRASVTWSGEGQRLLYAAGRESFGEPIAVTRRVGEATGSRRVRLEVESDGRVAFYVNDRFRWRSTAALDGAADGRRVRLWIGGRAVGQQVKVRDAYVELRAAPRD